MALIVKVGTADDDTFDFSNRANDRFDISGLGGDDKITGGKLNDILRGGGGNDVMKGEAGSDKMQGGAGNDVLFGGDGKDFLNGGSGVDFLNGNGGDGEMTGGGGTDNFQVDLGAGRIFITDFTDNVDTLLLDGDFFPGKTVTQILQRFGSSSGGDSAIDLSRTGADAPRIILLGVDNIFDLTDDITIV